MTTSAPDAAASAFTYIAGTPNRLPASSHPRWLDSPSSRYGAGRSSDARGIATHGCTRQKSPREFGSSAAITSSTSNRSAIERVDGTTTSIVGTSGQLPRAEITLRDGVYAHSALFDARARPAD